MSNTLSPQNRIHSSKRPSFALSVATSLAFLAVAVLSLVLIGSDTAYASFNPTASASLSDTSPGANANIRTEFNLPAPNVNFSALIAFTPADFFVATDADITNGHGVAFLKAGVTLGLINGPCSPGGVTAEFQMMDATTNISGPTVVFEDDGDPGTTFEIFEGENTDSWATAAELPKGAAKYPDFLLRIFKDENGQTLQPRTRLYGQTQVVGNDVSLNFVFFQPGTTFKNPTTGQVFTTDPTLGYPSVTILQDLGDPDVKPNPDSTITDFCTPLDTVITTCGVAQETRSLMNRNDPCPSGSGTPTRTNPTSDMTLNFVTFTAGLPDADGDGLENSLDTCPYDINEENPREAAIRDSDGIDPACDPDPDDWCGGEPDAFSIVTKFGTDCDKDGFVNSADNCPLIANPEQGKADADSDGIGNACDRDSTTAEGGRPIVCLVMPVDIGAGGTPPFTAADLVCTIDGISITGGPAPTPTPGPGANTAPVCGGAEVTTTADTLSASFSLDCSDADGDALTCSVVTEGEKGTLNITNCESATYTPNPNETGDDSVTYKANDGSLDSAPATVSVTIVATEKKTVNVKAGKEGGTGREPSKTDPLETMVTACADATITFEEKGGGEVAAGFGIIGLQSIITSTTTCSATDPFVIRFALDVSLIPEGEDENTIQIFKDAVQVGEPCTGGDGATDLSPDPCVFKRETEANGDVVLTVKSSTLSSWTFGVAESVVLGTDTGGTGTGGAAGGAATGVGSLAPIASSIPAWAAIASALGGAGLLGSLGAFASRIFRRRR